MVNEINIKELENTLKEQYQLKVNELQKKIDEIKGKLLACTDKDEFEDLIWLYESRQNKLNNIDKESIKKTIEAAKLFNTMAKQLNNEFNAEIDTEKHTIRFKWFGKTLSFPVILLSKKYNFHSGVFGFESGFTTHEAYTPDNFMFHIGIDKNDADTIIINFGNFEIFAN